MSRRALEAEPRGLPAYAGPTYYDIPVVKAPPWEWHVPTYVFIGGTGAGAALVGAVARVALPEGRAVARDAHLLGAGAAALGAPLLIADLKTPERFHEMLRIFRPTSPMSIGSWTLSAFGLSTGLGAIAALEARDADGLAAKAADVMTVSAAATGALMATYTAALLTASAIPAWAAEPQLLPARYGASSVAAGAAALSLSARLRGSSASADRLDGVKALGAATALALTLLSERRLAAEGIDAPTREGEPGRKHEALKALYAAPVAIEALALLTGRRSAALSVAGSVATLAASYFTRSSIMEAGPPSAGRPRDYHTLTRPGRR